VPYPPEEFLAFYVPAEDDGLAAEHATISALVREVWAAGWPEYRPFRLKQFPAGERIAAAGKEASLRVVRALLGWKGFVRAEEGIAFKDGRLPADERRWDAVKIARHTVGVVLDQLLRRNLPYAAADMTALAAYGAGHADGVLKVLEFFAATQPVTPDIAAAVTRLADAHEKTSCPDAARVARALRGLLPAGAEPPAAPCRPVARLPAPRPAPAGCPAVMVALKAALGMGVELPEVATTPLPPDGFPLRADSPLAAEHRVVAELLTECIPPEARRLDVDLHDVPTGHHILTLPPTMRGRILVAAAERAAAAFSPAHFEPPEGNPWAAVYGRDNVADVASALIAPDVAFSREQLFDFLLWHSTPHRHFHSREDLLGGLLTGVAPPLSEGERYVLHRLRTLAVPALPLGTAPAETAPLTALLGDMPVWVLIPGDAWADALNDAIADAPPERQKDWIDLIAHATTASSSRPTAKWLKTAQAVVSAIGPADVRTALVRAFAQIPAGRSVPADGDPASRLAMNSENETALRGLLWVAPLAADADLARAVGAAAVSLYKKVPGKGPRAVKAGNAAVYALSAMGGPAALGQLAVLKTRVHFGTAQAEIEKAFTAAAERAQLPREDIEELAVPACGLVDVGVRQDTLGNCTATLRAAGPGDVALSFAAADGRPLKAAPAAVKKEFKDDLKELQDAAKDIARLLPAQAERLESLFLQGRNWPLAAWRERYLDHPLVGVLARRLIWTVTHGGVARAGLWRDGGLVDADGRPLSVPAGDVRVGLWHPVAAGAGQAAAWRRLIEASDVVQPFKQAHREVYVLTEAERGTRTYSNRFAAHVIRQHQFGALAAARGWKHKLRLMVDDVCPAPSREVPAYGLRAEFWVEPVGDTFGVDTTEAGAFLRVATDQIRFYPLDAPANFAHAQGGGYEAGRAAAGVEPVPLEQVPPLVFSEILRDVDLFVGVASVGNDPTWADGDPGGRHRAYWEAYSDGELTATAVTRRELLARLVPRLKIAGRASIEERYLVIRGELRTYRIHLGSGAVLMEPDRRHLCIVPNRAAAQGAAGVRLPFEGDGMLSIILSKAFLLADDGAIADRSIVSQIRGTL
jgi:hypothetical protein